MTAGQTATLNIPLQVGNVTETVTVSGSAELIDTIITLFAPLVFCALNLTATCDLQRYVAGFLQRQLTLMRELLSLNNADDRTTPDLQKWVIGAELRSKPAYETTRQPLWVRAFAVRTSTHQVERKALQRALGR